MCFWQHRCGCRLRLPFDPPRSMLSVLKGNKRFGSFIQSKMAIVKSGVSNISPKGQKWLHRRSGPTDGSAKYVNFRGAWHQALCYKLLRIHSWELSSYLWVLTDKNISYGLPYHNKRRWMEPYHHVLSQFFFVNKCLIYWFYVRTSLLQPT